MFKRIDHVEIITQDMEKTLDFYTKVLSFSIKHRQAGRPGTPWKEIVFLQLGDTQLEILSPAGPCEAPPAQERAGYRMMAIEVDDMDKTIAYLKTRGVELSRAPMLLGKSKRAEIKDPAGLSIELRQW